MTGPETRLLSFARQEAFYSAIASRYLAFCTAAGDKDELQKKFAELAVSETQRQYRPSAPAAGSSSSLLSASTNMASAASTGSIPAPPILTIPYKRTDLSQILSALRKLREAIVASQRRDAFATQAYLFAARLGVLAATPEAYYPSLLYLVRVLHHSPTKNMGGTSSNNNSDNSNTTTAATANSNSNNSSTNNAPNAAGRGSGGLTRVEHQEAAGYLVLDAACRLGDLAQAYALRQAHGVVDAKVDAVLRALATDDWVRWRRARASVDGYKARLMGFADERMRTHALKAFGRAYLSVSREFLETQLMSSWGELKQRDGVGWELDGSRVVIRKVPGQGKAR
jgi:hypothetical protein